MTTQPMPRDTAPILRVPGLYVTFLISLVVSLVTATSVVGIYDQIYAQKIMVMDLKGYIRSQRDKAMSNEISDDELRRKFDAMEAALLALPTNHIVILKDVVLRNAREIKP